MSVKNKLVWNEIFSVSVIKHVENLFFYSPWRQSKSKTCQIPIGKLEIFLTDGDRDQNL